MYSKQYLSTNKRELFLIKLHGKKLDNIFLNC